jgi:hypothetical protein
MPPQIDAEILEAALVGLEVRKAALDQHIQRVRAMLGGTPQTKGDVAKSAPKQRNLSAAGKKRIAEAAKKRWAEYRKKNAAGEVDS